MRHFRLFAVLCALTGMLTAEVQADEPIVGVREALQASLATEPYPVSDHEACAMAEAALMADNRAGGSNLPDGNLWEGDRPSNIECPGLTNVDISHATFRRFHLPRQNRDGRIFVAVDDLCDVTCYSGKTYEMTRLNGAWVAEPSGYSWQR